MDNAIEAHGLVKTYPGDVRALKGLSLAIAKGTVFGLLGPNGAGKSTTVKILTTLSRPDAGERHRGRATTCRRAGRVRRAIGVVAQQSGARPAGDRTREPASCRASVYGMRGAALRSRAEELLERFGLADAADRAVRTYSGGMQRRLDVAIGAGAPARGALPRRAHHRPRPRGARRHVGRDRAPVGDEGLTDPAHHPLPGGGRPPRRPAGHRRPGPGSSPRARPRSSRASCAATPSHVELGARADGGRSRGLRPVPALRRQLSRPRAARPRRRRRRAPCRRCSRPSTARVQGRVGDRGAALARRRVPAARRPPFRADSQELKTREPMTGLADTWP